jgi:hypothetical protein
MKKQFLNLGKALNKAEQKQINGGAGCIPPGSLYSSYETCSSNCAFDCTAYFCESKLMGYACLGEEIE